MWKKWVWILFVVLIVGILMWLTKFFGAERERTTAKNQPELLRKAVSATQSVTQTKIWEEPFKKVLTPPRTSLKTSITTPPSTEGSRKGMGELQKGLTDVLERAKKQEEIAERLSKMKTVGLAMLMYVEDWGGYYPPREKLSEALTPYIRNIEEVKDVFSDPNFRYSPPHSIEELKNPAETVAAEWRIFPDTTLFLFADGHIKVRR